MARKLVAVRADSAVVRMFTKLAKSSGSGFWVPTLREVAGYSLISVAVVVVVRGLRENLYV